jgi:hypothetical protein
MKRDCTNCGKLRTKQCDSPEWCIGRGYSDWSPERRAGDRRRGDRRDKTRS